MTLCYLAPVGEGGGDSEAFSTASSQTGLILFHFKSENKFSEVRINI
jgi:hypothetical protein